MSLYWEPIQVSDGWLDNTEETGVERCRPRTRRSFLTSLSWFILLTCTTKSVFLRRVSLIGASEGIHNDFPIVDIIKTGNRTNTRSFLLKKGKQERCGEEGLFLILYPSKPGVSYTTLT